MPAKYTYYCPGCGKHRRAAAAGRLCANCLKRGYSNNNCDEPVARPIRKQRILIYEQRASLGLPLFDDPHD